VRNPYNDKQQALHKRSPVNFCRFLCVCPSSKGAAGVFYRLFARYRYKLSGEKLVCGSEGDHPLI